MAYAQDTLTLGGSIVERIKAVRAALADRSAKNRVYRQTLRELDGLSDRDLADLGIVRADITDVAWAAAYKV
jgi:uncharacterized protein YjiS (DUF1127 family)